MLKLQTNIIPSHEINKIKWDECIAQSECCLIYASCDYLNYMCDHWHGVVAGDYEAVMPLPWRKKFGIRYSYDVPFIQQSGVFERSRAIDETTFVNALSKFYQYGDYSFHFNTSNNIISKATACTNFIIRLDKTYDLIQSSYEKSLQKNLKQASTYHLIYKESDVEKAVDYYIKLYQKRFTHVTLNDYDNFRELCKVFQTKQMIFAREVEDEKNTILSIALFLKDERRIYNIMPSVTEEGRVKQAQHFLLDNVLNEFAGSGLIFDFEGSDLPGVKAFYQKFGAMNQPYYRIHFNHLPVPFRWLKR